MLEIKNLHVAIDGKEIIKGLDLSIKAGEVHAIMGPNGTGKSTLASVIAGNEDYEITQGSIVFNGEDLAEMEVEERSLAGIFLAFQYPVEIPGVSMINFMRTVIDERRKNEGLEPMPPAEFLKLVKEKSQLVEINERMKGRAVNEGFSGGEKKKNEVFQMAMIDPKLAIMDETDSGLDIDALRIVAKGVNEMRSEKNAFVVITHYQRLLDYIVPDFVHIMNDGKIVKSGDKQLAVELEEKGYENLF
jgi:Fe-S cluster assembly ATP-binding protein